MKLNAIGKPFSPQYDPNYRMRYKPSYGHLRAPYSSEMRFVGDPPRTDKQRRRVRRLKLLPLLDGQSESEVRPADQLVEIIRAGKAFLKTLEKFQRAQFPEQPDQRQGS